jgi:UDP-GlcNAc3NAcA epimerase
MKITTIIGARPQFIKAAVVSRAIAESNKLVTSNSSLVTETIVHTGQHYDRNMSDIFFEEMNIPRPDYFLNINSLSHGAMTGQMLEEIEEVLQQEKPEITLVYGDTNTTLAGALAAVKLHIPVAHIEAGLRSFNRRMPEEINRVLTDHVANYLFCPTEQAVRNLKDEGIEIESSSADKLVSSPGRDKEKKQGSKTKNLATHELKNSKAHNNYELPPKVAMVGDVMLDAAMYYRKFARKPGFELAEKFILATIHRAENTDDPSRLKSIFKGINEIGKEVPIYLPLHPRTRKILETLSLKTNLHTNIKIIEPVSYLEMIYMLEKCMMVMTDSGGLQKEAFFFKKPCVTLRNETEWVELVENGFNYLAGAKAETIYNAYKNNVETNYDFSLELYGDGKAGEKILDFLMTCK